MNAFRAPVVGEFESEVALPCRVEYRIDTDGELQITGVIPLEPHLFATVKLHFAALPLREQRCLEAEAEAAAKAAKEAVETDRRLEHDEARRSLD